jgi:release factor glutamine methyltransferase
MANKLKDVLNDSRIVALERRILAAFVLNLSRVELVTQSERSLSAREASAIEQLFARRIAGEPIAYLTGQREFWGRPFQVGPDVLIPRPETELLVELALAHGEANEPLNVLELGAGSGVVALTIALERPLWRILAIDQSLPALTVLEKNAHALGARIEILQSDWYQKIPSRRFDLILSNPPYIAGTDSHLACGDLRFEPRMALTDEADGWMAIETIIAGATERLSRSGRLFFEHGYEQGPGARARLTAAGLKNIQTWNDLAGIERVSGGTA